MAAEQGKDPRTGPVPALNTDRIYSTTIPAQELARSNGAAGADTPQQEARA